MITDLITEPNAAPHERSSAARRGAPDPGPAGPAYRRPGPAR
ncbi:hypothetical protein [Streptomyces altiplanensis]